MKAVLTGHSRGLGAALATELLDRNIEVLGIARTKSADSPMKRPSLTQVALDLSDPTALTEWLAGDPLRPFLAGSKTIMLINNAGVVWPVGPIPTQNVAAIAQAVNVNVAAPLMLASAVIQASQATQPSHDARDIRIVHISSGAARNAYPGWSIYCATKAALDHHARAVALDQTSGIRICSLAPGVIDTDMQAEVRSTPVEHFPMRQRFEDLKREGQLSDPAVCARQLVDYLLSHQFGHKPVEDLRSIGS